MPISKDLSASASHQVVRGPSQGGITIGISLKINKKLEILSVSQNLEVVVEENYQIDISS